jgi:hypothetical protein
MPVVSAGGLLEKDTVKGTVSRDESFFEGLKNQFSSVHAPMVFNFYLSRKILFLSSCLLL